MIVDLIIGSLAVYGLSKLLVEQDGFMDVFYKLRGVEWLKMLTCVTCTAVWVSIPVFVVVLLGATILLLPFAILGIVIILEEIL